MRPPPSEREGGGGNVASTGRLLLTPNTSHKQQALTPALLMEWREELRRRLDRATALVELGLPDSGFDLLSEEVHRFNRACLAYAASPRTAAA
jgi:hypothetical protein